MDVEKRQRTYRTIMLIILTVFITFLSTTIYMSNIIENDGTVNYVTISGNGQKIETTIESFRNLIDEKFLGEIDEEKLLEGAVKGYVEGLEDEYTEYFTKEELEDFYTNTMGNYDGIGISMIKSEDNLIVILTPIKDSPADHAGILPGDIILSVDGVIYSGDQMTEASDKIKGKAGTKVKLEINRDGEIIPFEIERASIKMYHVESEVLENKIGYLELSTFDEGSSKELLEKFNELKEQGITSLIIDLRNNPGGLVQEAIDMADYAIEKGSLLLITKDKKEKVAEFKAKNGVTIDMPIVVLVNEYSASASEILAGALQDHDKAYVIGVQTYGKGLIQELITLSDGSGIKITTAEYYTPNENKINKIGITPDEVVESKGEFKNKLDIPKEEDIQLQRAIEYLKK